MRSAPLFLQALGLVLATLLAVLVTTAVVVLRLSPPHPEIYTLAEVAQALRTGQPTAVHDGQPLQITRSRTPPAQDTQGRGHTNFRNGVALLLKRSADDIVIVQNEPRVVAFGPVDRKHRPPPFARDQPILFGPFQAALKQADGTWIVAAPRHPLIGEWQKRVLLVLGLAALAVTPLAWIFSRRMAAPIAAFAVAAERLGRDPAAPPLDIRGSSEVDVAVRAFNEMQQRLKRYVDYRTAMVGAIAHDLRTPLTRLRFRVEAAPEDLRGKLVADIDQMEAMVAATLAFVQDAGRSPVRTRLELASLVETVIDDAAETGADAAVERADRVVVDADPVALKRLVTNLVDNALKFGSRARCQVYADGAMAVLEVSDNGPGVPEAEVERAFEPFHRLENSRSRETGGIGLGLAVARAIARGHGGEVTLQNRPEGGLCARLALPLAVRARKPAAQAAAPHRAPLTSPARPQTQGL
ncbi:MAG: ATP-binding protein [Caulobacterales bacterium]